MPAIWPHKNMGLRLLGALAVAGGLLYFAKERIATRRKAELDQYRAASSEQRRG
ncbi:hypothetical protein FA13DRAFT_1789367 [Coprinellus micaceus]|uniref:Uncharacterized protein n=1 Tax=Coprinellus micaceus TaxID=71717 RepID=A0A4Y7TL34_COPMI|nr:hypothetical protein FA13DRAFT_1789367 [Coprinellus micaceus]